MSFPEKKNTFQKYMLWRTGIGCNVRSNLYKGLWGLFSFQLLVNSSPRFSQKVAAVCKLHLFFETFIQRIQQLFNLKLFSYTLASRT